MVSPVRVGQPRARFLVALDTVTTVGDKRNDEIVVKRSQLEDAVSQPDQLELRIDVGPMPTVWCTEPAALSLGLQSGRDNIVRGTETDNGVRFDVAIGVKRGRDGGVDFTGPLVHGPPGERFLYLSWGKVTADEDHVMFRRLKLYLCPVARKGWSSPGVSWQQVNQGSVTTSVSGQGPDGTPHCGTAQVFWTLHT